MVTITVAVIVAVMCVVTIAIPGQPLFATDVVTAKVTITLAISAITVFLTVSVIVTSD